MATYSVHDAGVRQARRLIDDGKYDATTEWSGAAPSADDENRGSRSSTRSPKRRAASACSVGLQRHGHVNCPASPCGVGSLPIR